VSSTVHVPTLALLRTSEGTDSCVAFNSGLRNYNIKCDCERVFDSVSMLLIVVDPHVVQPEYYGAPRHLG